MTDVLRLMQNSLKSWNAPNPADSMPAPGDWVRVWTGTGASALVHDAVLLGFAWEHGGAKLLAQGVDGALYLSGVPRDEKISRDHPYSLKKVTVLSKPMRLASEVASTAEILALPVVDALRATA